MVSMDTYFAGDRRHLPSPGNDADPSILEGETSEHGAPYKFAGWEVGRINLGTQQAGPIRSRSKQLANLGVALGG